MNPRARAPRVDRRSVSRARRPLAFDATATVRLTSRHARARRATERARERETFERVARDGIAPLDARALNRTKMTDETKRNPPPSLEDLAKKRREDASAVMKPTFLSKEERAKAAIARREAEVAAQRTRAEEGRKAAAPPPAAVDERDAAERADVSVRASIRRGWSRTRSIGGEMEVGAIVTIEIEVGDEMSKTSANASSRCSSDNTWAETRSRKR